MEKITRIWMPLDNYCAVLHSDLDEYEKLIEDTEKQEENVSKKIEITLEECGMPDAYELTVIYANRKASKNQGYYTHSEYLENSEIVDSPFFDAMPKKDFIEYILDYSKTMLLKKDV